MSSQRSTTAVGQLRDALAYRLANAALRLATPWYRRMIRGAIDYGMRSAARDATAGTPSPPPVIVFDHVKGEVRTNDSFDVRGNGPLGY